MGNLLDAQGHLNPKGFSDLAEIGTCLRFYACRDMQVWREDRIKTEGVSMETPFSPL